jgi:hypothetical protein
MGVEGGSGSCQRQGQHAQGSRLLKACDAFASACTGSEKNRLYRSAKLDDLNSGGQKYGTSFAETGRGLGSHGGIDGWVPSPISKHVSTSGHQSEPGFRDTTCRLRENMRQVWLMLAQRAPGSLLHTLDLPILVASTSSRHRAPDFVREGHSEMKVILRY